MSDPIVTRSEYTFSTISVIFRRDHYQDGAEAWADLAVVNVVNCDNKLSDEERDFLVQQICESSDRELIINAILDSIAGKDIDLE